MTCMGLLKECFLFAWWTLAGSSPTLVSKRFTLVADLGRRLFPLRAAQKQGVHGLVSDSNFMNAGVFEIALCQDDELALIDFTLAGSGIGPADTKHHHRRLGYPRQSVVRAIDKKKPPDIAYSTSMSLAMDFVRPFTLCWY